MSLNTGEKSWCSSSSRAIWQHASISLPEHISSALHRRLNQSHRYGSKPNRSMSGRATKTTVYRLKRVLLVTDGLLPERKLRW